MKEINPFHQLTLPPVQPLNNTGTRFLGDINMVLLSVMLLWKYFPWTSLQSEFPCILCWRLFQIFWGTPYNTGWNVEISYTFITMARSESGRRMSLSLTMTMKASVHISIMITERIARQTSLVLKLCHKNHSCRH